MTVISDIDGDEIKATKTIPTVVEGTAKNSNSVEPPKDSEQEPPKKLRGWPSRPPFSKNFDDDESSKNNTANQIYWGELTLKQKLEWRKAFVLEYLREAKLCLPHVRKLFLMIYRISPWRAIVVFVLNVVSGLLPALTLQTRGNFILMVNNLFDFG
jgi:hypothetical protein